LKLKKLNNKNNRKGLSIYASITLFPLLSNFNIQEYVLFEVSWLFIDQFFNNFILKFKLIDLKLNYFFPIFAEGDRKPDAPGGDADAHRKVHNGERQPREVHHVHPVPVGVVLHRPPDPGQRLPQPPVAHPAQARQAVHGSVVIIVISWGMGIYTLYIKL
jgi:hypothetical protein